MNRPMNGAVITALNEQDTIGQLVERLIIMGLSVCVVSDGSTDDTEYIAANTGAHVIHHDAPQGIGKSLVEAWRYAISQRWDFTFQLDAGGSHDPLYIHALENRGLFTRKTPADVTVGSRFMPHLESSEYLGGSWWRKLGSRITAAALNFATHQHITDWTSGYRCFSLKALRALVDVRYLTNMHTWQIEVLHQAIKRGLTIAEAPITYRAGKSSFSWRLLDDLIKVYLVVFFS